jgi:hypothetical protein
MPLPEFDPSSLEAAKEAFQAAPAVELDQPWLPAREPGFQPTTVRIGWLDDALLVLAEMQDTDIFSRSTALNQRMWELGDVFEIFVRPAQQSAYLEFHVTANNHRLQLRFADEPAYRSAQLSDVFTPFFLEGNVIESAVWLRPEENRWFVLARIPARTVCDCPRPLSGQEWFFSFCRYDYRHGCDTPVRSSSSCHRKLDFHVQSPWNSMRFSEG